MNARDNSPAAISDIGIPRNASGTAERSSLSRTSENMNMDTTNPMEAKNPNKTEVTISFPF